MKKLLLMVALLLVAGAASAQFRMVSNGNPSWTTVNDSTYTSTVSFQSDLTGKGYLANQIADTFFLLTPLEKLYRVSSVTNPTFSSAELTVVEVTNEYVTTDGLPSGQVIVFDATPKGEIPQSPTGSTGATAQLQAAISAYNSKVQPEGGLGTEAQPNFFYYEDNTAGADYSLPLDTLLKYDFMTISMRVSDASDNVITLPDLPTSGDAHNGKTVIVHLTGQEALPGRGIIDAAGVSAIRSTYCYSNGTVFQPDTVSVDSGDDVFLVYRTNEKDDYFRQCEQGIVSGGTYISPGDTLPDAGMVYETITVGGATLDVGYRGGSIAFTNPASGQYTITPSGGADIEFASITGDNTTLNASQEMVLTVDNSTNSAPRRFALQLYDDNNNGLVDQHATGTNHTQSVTTNSTTITVPGLNGFGATGYVIELR